jgi:hypothetical protein
MEKNVEAFMEQIVEKNPGEKEGISPGSTGSGGKLNAIHREKS